MNSVDPCAFFDMPEEERLDDENRLRQKWVEDGEEKAYEGLETIDFEEDFKISPAERDARREAKEQSRIKRLFRELYRPSPKRVAAQAKAEAAAKARAAAQALAALEAMALDVLCSLRDESAAVKTLLSLSTAQVTLPRKEVAVRRVVRRFAVRRTPHPDRPTVGGLRPGGYKP
jgi:hypothetical protein